MNLEKEHPQNFEYPATKWRCDEKVDSDFTLVTPSLNNVDDEADQEERPGDSKSSHPKAAITVQRLETIYMDGEGVILWKGTRSCLPFSIVTTTALVIVGLARDEVKVGRGEWKARL